MIDSHCHLADDAFAGDVDQVIGRAQVAGITRALCILAADSETEAVRARGLLGIWPALRFAIGLHPHQAGRFAGRESEVTRLVREAIEALPETRAVGEIGLDYHYDYAPRDVQQTVFRHQLRLARELRLPVVIHTREAEDVTIALVRAERGGCWRPISTPPFGRKLLHRNRLFVDTPSRNMVRSSGLEER